MDENYYRELIDKVKQNEKRMWKRNETPNDGFDDFSQLWEIANDNEANVSPQTYFEAVDLCMTSFFGTVQEHSHVWRNILSHYERALNNNEGCKDVFNEEFEKFLENFVPSIPDMDIFYDLMHLGLDDGNLRLVIGLVGHSPIDVECWDQLEDDYNRNPEWAAYYECFTDVSYEHLPDSPIFKDTIHRIYSKFGNIPEYEKLRRLHYEYFGD